MGIIYEIRRRDRVQKHSIFAIARNMDISRSTVLKRLKTVEEPKYYRTTFSSPKLGQFAEPLIEWLMQESREPLKNSQNLAK